MFETREARSCRGIPTMKKERLGFGNTLRKLYFRNITKLTTMIAAIPMTAIHIPNGKLTFWFSSTLVTSLLPLRGATVFAPRPMLFWTQGRLWTTISELASPVRRA